MSAMVTAVVPSAALAFVTHRGGVWSSLSSLKVKTVKVGRRGVKCVVRAAAGESNVDVDVKKGDVLPSGEWAENFSMLNYEDLSKYYEDILFKPEV